jgi:hypothetical protein
MRPFNPILRNRVHYEVKYGEKKTTSSGKTYPSKLKHFKFVSRDRSGDNFTTQKNVHDVIGKEPNTVPIILFSDNPQEVFSIYRGAFNQSTLMCGAQTGDEVAMRRFAMTDTDVNENGVHSGGRITQPISIVEQPYPYACNEKCELWVKGGGGKGCNLHGRFYFMLNLSSNIPQSSSFCVLRITGIFAQMSLSSSLDIIKKMTGGILAGLPLKLRLDYEKLNRTVEVNGKFMRPDIPYISVEPGVPYQDFMRLATEEIKRRHLVSQITGKPIIIDDVLGASLKREALFEDAEEVVEDTSPEIKPVSKSPEIDWDAIFDGSGYTKRKRELLIKKHKGDPIAVSDELSGGEYIF